MKNINYYISEKLNIKNIKVHQYTCQPKTKEELRAIIEERLKNDDNADLNDIDVSEITDMSALFFRKFPHNINISEWDVSNVTDMTSMFMYGHEFNANLSKWDVSNVKSMRYMFCDCNKFEAKGLENWKPSKCEDMYNMFKDTYNANIPSWYKP